MGATNFQTAGHGETAAAAFRDAADEAAFMNGHGGYTGTIAEKHSFIEFTLPAGKTPEDLTDAISAAEFAEEPLPAWLPKRVATTYWDKWGPAIAMKIAPDIWVFVGMASE